MPMLWHTHGITDLAQLNNVRNFARWKARGTGPLASNIGEAGAFFASRDGLPAPDMQIHMAPRRASTTTGCTSRPRGWSPRRRPWSRSRAAAT